MAEPSIIRAAGAWDSGEVVAMGIMGGKAQYAEARRQANLAARDLDDSEKAEIQRRRAESAERRATEVADAEKRKSTRNEFEAMMARRRAAADSEKPEQDPTLPEASQASQLVQPEAGQSELELKMATRRTASDSEEATRKGTAAEGTATSQVQHGGRQSEFEQMMARRRAASDPEAVKEAPAAQIQSVVPNEVEATVTRPSHPENDDKGSEKSVQADGLEPEVDGHVPSHPENDDTGSEKGVKADGLEQEVDGPVPSHPENDDKGSEKGVKADGLEQEVDGPVRVAETRPVPAELEHSVPPPGAQKAQEALKESPTSPSGVVAFSGEDVAAQALPPGAGEADVVQKPETITKDPPQKCCCTVQ